MRPVGWRYESVRHSYAARGISTGRRYNYVPTYVAGDLPLIATDALGTAGASAVSMIPVVVPVALAYGGAKLIKKHMKKKRKKRKYDAEKKVNEVGQYVDRELKSNGKSTDFLKSVSEQIRHPIRDMDKDWQSMVKASGHKYKKENGVQLAEDRAAAVFGKVVTQANVEPLVDKHEIERPVRQETLDILFGRRAYAAYKPGTVTMRTVQKLRLVPVRRVHQSVPSKAERNSVKVGDRVAVLAEGMGRGVTFPSPDKIWLRVSSVKRRRIVGRIESGTRYAPLMTYRKISFAPNNVVELQRGFQSMPVAYRPGRKV